LTHWLLSYNEFFSTKPILSYNNWKECRHEEKRATISFVNTTCVEVLSIKIIFHQLFCDQVLLYVEQPCGAQRLLCLRKGKQSAALFNSAALFTFSIVAQTLESLEVYL